MMENETNLPLTVDSRSQNLTPDAHFTNTVSDDGVSLGDLMEMTGLAISETQHQLNIVSAQKSNELAETMMDVIAVQENIYDDHGKLVETKSHSQCLPLVNFIDPIFYQWSDVRIQGQYYVNGFASEAESHRNRWISSRRSGQGGVFVILGGSRSTGEHMGMEGESSVPSYRSSSFGRLRMNAMLKPRTDITISKPKRVMRGPNLSIIQGEIIDFRENGIGPVTSRTISVMIEYRKMNGSPIENKSISIETRGASWQFSGNPKTNSEGQVEILLTRIFLDDSVDRSPSDVTVSARIGLVESSGSLIF